MVGTAAVIKNNVKPILFTVLAIVILILLYKIIKRTTNGAGVIIDLIAKEAETKSITTQSGINPNRVNELRKVAEDLSYHLETGVDSGFWINIFTPVLADSIERDLVKVQGKKEMQVVESFYTNLFTKGRYLKSDIDSNTFMSPKSSFTNYYLLS